MKSSNLVIIVVIIGIVGYLIYKYILSEKSITTSTPVNKTVKSTTTPSTSLSSSSPLAQMIKKQEVTQYLLFGYNPPMKTNTLQEKQAYMNQLYSEEKAINKYTQEKISAIENNTYKQFQQTQNQKIQKQLLSGQWNEKITPSKIVHSSIPSSLQFLNYNNPLVRRDYPLPKVSK
ncbi:MAG: hypothetical protein QW478_11440 [Candidatus Micrarchaeaceae archaeon]